MLNVRNMCGISTNSQTCECKPFQTKPSRCKYFPHSLQGQLYGVDFFNF